MSVVNTLRQAQRLLGKDGRWVKGEFGAADVESEYGGTERIHVPPASSRASMFCSLGAVQHVLGLNEDGVFDFENFEGKKPPTEAEIRARESEFQSIKDLLDQAAGQYGLTIEAAEIMDGGCNCSDENEYLCERCELIDESLTYATIIDLNDAEGTTIEDVLNAFAAAIKYAKAHN